MALSLANSSQVLERVLKGEITALEAATKLGTTEEAIWAFVQQKREIIKKTDELDKEPETTENVVDTLNIVSKKLKKRVFQLLENPVDSSNSKMVSQELSTWEKIIMDIAKLTNQLQEKPEIQINQIKLEMNHIQNFMFTELCPICKHKFIEHLEREVSEHGENLGTPVLPRENTGNPQST